MVAKQKAILQNLVHRCRESSMYEIFLHEIFLKYVTGEREMGGEKMAFICLEQVMLCI